MNVRSVIRLFAAPFADAVPACRESRTGRVPKELIWLGAAGLCAGLALYFKPTAGVMLGFVLVAVALASLLSRTLTRGILGLSTVIIGAMLAAVPLLSYFAFSGALSDFYEANITFNTYHVQTGANLTLAQMISATLDFGARMGFLAPLAALGAIVVVMRREAGGIAIAVWFVFLMAGVWAQGKFFSYHWSTLLAPLSLMAAIGLQALSSEWRKRSAELVADRAMGLALVTVPLLILGYGVVLYKDQAPKLGRDLSYFLRLSDEQAYLAHFGHNLRGIDVYSFGAARDTARYVAERTNPDDKVLVWGFQALVNFLSDRRSPTRYVFNYPLTIDQPDSDLRATARATFLEEMQRNRPKYIVLVTNDVNPLQPVDSFTLLNGFSELKNLVFAEYALEKDIEDFHIYRLKGQEPQTK